MFWKYNLVTGSSIDNLLDKENVTLKELMDDDDILQECKAQTKKLIDFLVQPEILNEMITLINEEPAEGDEKLRYRYSNLACELLTFDIAQINDALASDEAVLSKLCNFLKSQKPLNPLLASFFSKTMGLLISKKTEPVFNFMKDKEFIPLALNHLDTSAVMDLLLRCVTSIENSEMRIIVIKWLDDQKFIQQLVSRIDVEYDEDVICNASYTLCNLIKCSREHMSLLQEKVEHDPLLDTVESVEVILELLHHMFNDVTKDSAIVNGILVLLELLMFKKEGGIQQVSCNQNELPVEADKSPSCYMSLFKNFETKQMTALDAERLSIGVNNVLTAVTPHLEKFHNLLLKPPVKPAITLTIGCLNPPLGSCRIEVAHLLAALISNNNHHVNVKLASLETVVVLMDMFFEYSWNNFLHTYVEHSIVKIVTNSPTVDDEGNKVHPLLDQILSHYKMTIKILEKFDEKPERPERKGYMGHLTNIANSIAQNAEGCVNSTFITEKLKELPEDHLIQWETFVNGTLSDINKKNTIQPLNFPSLSDSSSEKNSFGKDVFTDYPMQGMTSDFVDQFGFKDDEFGDGDEILSYGKIALNPLTGNFSLSGENSGRSAELFEELCRVKINPDGDAVSWDDRDQTSTFSTHFGMNKSSDDNSSDSDDECQVFESRKSIIQTSDEVKMDVDNQEGLVPMDIAPATFSNPWGSTESNSATGDQRNWADFGNFPAFGASTSEKIGDADQSSITSVDQKNWATFGNFDAFGTSTSVNSSVTSSIVSVAMETSETVSDTSTLSKKIEPLEKNLSEK